MASADGKLDISISKSIIKACQIKLKKNGLDLTMGLCYELDMRLENF